MTNYDEYVSGKIIEASPSGFDIEDLNPALFSYQRDIVRWAIRRGKAALFESPGLGKSIQEWEFAKHTSDATGKPALIFAPLAVAEQMSIEAPQFGYQIHICKSQSDIRPGINVTNYERLERFTPDDLGTIIADESSILKAGSFGKTARLLTEFASGIPYRLAATATPAPNDMDEILYHAEFLGIMREQEAKALFFVQDGNSSNKMRLKMNAVNDYYRWLASWAVALRTPSDLGYSDEGFIRPPVNYTQITVDIDTPIDTGMLVAVEAIGIAEQRAARNATMEERVKTTAAIVNASQEQWLVWCDLNNESEALRRAIPDAVEVKGSDSPEHKIDALVGYKSGKYRVVVSKPSMWGFGLNLQNSWNMIFCGLGNSFEQYLQAIARQDRFGQKNIVNVYVVVSSADGAVVQNIKRKWVEHDKMYDELIKHVTVYTDLSAGRRAESKLDANKTIEVPGWLKPTSTPEWTPPIYINCDIIPFVGMPDVRIGDPVGSQSVNVPAWINSVV